jgi:DNA polymerase III epsilon subunit-like protein
MPDNSGAPLWARFISNTEQFSRSQATGWKLPPGTTKVPPPERARPDCPLPYDWDRRRYVALDVETTGLDPSKDRVVEVGLLQFFFDQEGALREEKEWSSLINPGISIPTESTAIHGIADLDVWQAPAFSTSLSLISEMLEGRVVVAHNAPFDISFFAQEFKRGRSFLPDLEIADTLILLRAAMPGLISYNLGKAAFVMGIETGASHRALDDARACMHIFARSARILSGACP